MLISKKHKKLVFNLKEPSRITAVIPTAKTLVHKGTTLVAVPHKLEEVRVLRNLGFDVPAPMSYYYDWPGRYKPYAHQQVTSEFLTINPRSFCLNGMGCIAGDERVRVSRKGRSYETTLRELHAKYHAMPDKDTWKVRSLMGDRFGMNRLLDSLNKGEQQTLRFTLADGKNFRCTPDHRIARPDGSWTEAGDLVVGDALVTNGEVMLACPQCGVERGVHKYYVATAKRLNRACRQCKHDAHSVRMAGGNNPAYKGTDFKDKDGYMRAWCPNHHRTDNSGRVYRHILVAEAAYGLVITAEHHVHHINGVKDDNRPENLEVLLAADHHRQHDPRIKLDGSVSGKGGVVMVLPKQSEIVSIEDGGVTDVYDLCMEGPNHNFVVNGVVVHNSGKTVSVLWSFDYLKKLGLVKRMLIISPLSTLERAWGDEIFRHFPELTFTVLHGDRAKRHKLLACDFDIYIINHDGIKAKETLELLATRDGLDVVVIDEIASFRNASTDRWKALNFLVNGHEKRGLPPKQWVWGLTGTPTPNAPTDAWAQSRLISPTRVARYFGQFRDAVMRQAGPHKFVAREGATEIVKHAMQPSVRFAREDCIDLPPTTYVTRETTLTPDQTKAFNQMLTRLRAEHEGGQITAVNEAVKMSKLLQICCLRYDTNVLTRRGWVAIVDVLRTDQVWDGQEWVNHDGSAFMGNKPVVNCGGVFMTDNHLVLSSQGWVTAKELNDGNASKRLDWASVRFPDGYKQSGDQYGQDKESDLAVPVQLRQRSSTRESILAHKAPHNTSELWVQPRQSDPQDVSDAALRCMGRYAQALWRHCGQRLVKLRGAGDRSLRSMARIVWSVLGGYAVGLQRQADARTYGQRRPVLATELPLGDTCSARQQQAVQQTYRNSSGAYDTKPSISALWSQASDIVRKVKSVQMDGRSGANTAVYDLLNCGPRNRFVVRNGAGELRVVHNCGVAYGADGGEVSIPATPRIELVREIIEEAEGKVLVFVPLTAALKTVAAELSKSYPVAIVHGETSKAQRDEIFKEFQQAKDPRVLVANPGTLSHGLTLTAANVVVWFAPIFSNETYQQACARVTRPGQTRNTLIVNIEATTMERKIYEKLQGKQKMQGLLLDLLKEG